MTALNFEDEFKDNSKELVKVKITTIFDINTKHLGGNPNIKQGLPVSFEFRSDGIFRIGIFDNWKFDYQAINPKDIIKCEYKTEQEIRQSVSVGGLLMFGALAFGMKNKRKVISNYMLFDYKLNNIPVNCLFEAKDGQKLSQLVYKINEKMLNNKKILAR